MEEAFPFFRNSKCFGIRNDCALYQIIIIFFFCKVKNTDGDALRKSTIPIKKINNNDNNNNYY